MRPVADKPVKLTPNKNKGSKGSIPRPPMPKKPKGK